MVLERNGIVESAEAAAARSDQAVAEALSRLAAPAVAAAPETPQGVPGRAGLPVDAPAEIAPQAPVQAAPVEAPVQTAPVEAPVQTAPVEAPVQTAPVEAPVQAAPVEAPVQAAPVEAPMQQAPVQTPNVMPAPAAGSPVQYVPLSAEAAAASKPRRRADVSEPVVYQPYSG